MISHYDNERIKSDAFFMKRAKLLSIITEKFNCIRCGQCCEESNPSLLYPELKHFGQDKVIWDEPSNNYRLKKPCEFYKESKEIDKTICKTQNYKPVSCKIYPFSFGHTDLGPLSIVLCPLGAEIFSSYTKYCDKIGKHVVISTVKLLGEDNEKTLDAKEIFNKEFSEGGVISIHELILKINNIKSENDIIYIKTAIPIDFNDTEDFAKYLEKS